MSSDWKNWIRSKLDGVDDTLTSSVPGYGIAKKITLNTITLGGQAALETSKRLYGEERQLYEAGATSFNRVLREVTAANEVLGTDVSTGVVSIEKARELVQRLSYGRVCGATSPHRVTVQLSDLHSADDFVREFKAAQEIGLGTGAGVAASAGAWFLVAHLGIASTGAAIGTLSGAAAYSATLAWFGGGALAAGGGGIALGGMVLSGIAALPVFAFAAYKSYVGALDTDKARKELFSKRKANETAEADMQRLLPRITYGAEQVRTITRAFVIQHEEIKNRAFILAAELSAQLAAFAQRLSSLERVEDH